MLEKVYTAKEAATHLHVNVACIYRLYHAGLLKMLKLGCLKVRESELQRFIEWAEGKSISDTGDVELLKEE